MVLVLPERKKPANAPFFAVDPDVEEIISHYDIILDRSDNFKTRYILDDACYILKNPWSMVPWCKWKVRFALPLNVYMSEKKPKKVFVEGPVSPSFIADSISKHSGKTEIGAHSLFLGQVRNDEIDGKRVRAIEYTAYTEMADDIFHSIREDAFEKYDLTCLHIYHSLGVVKAGGISLFVFTSSNHRKAAIDACSYIVERIKQEAPVWGMEIMEDNSYFWKQNTDQTPFQSN